MNQRYLVSAETLYFARATTYLDPLLHKVFTGKHLPKHFSAPASNGCEETRPKVPGRVDSIARVEAHGGSNNEDNKANCESLQPSGDRVVVGIDNSQDTNNQGGSANELRRAGKKKKNSIHISILIKLFNCSEVHSFRTYSLNWNIFTKSFHGIIRPQ